MNIQIKGINSVTELSCKLGEEFMIKTQTQKRLLVLHNNVHYNISYNNANYFKVEIRPPLWLIIFPMILLLIGNLMIKPEGYILVVIGLVSFPVIGAIYKSNHKNDLQKAVDLLTRLN